MFHFPALADDPPAQPLPQSPVTTTDAQGSIFLPLQRYTFGHKDLSMSTFYELTGMFFFFHIIGTRLLESGCRSFRSIENLLTKTTGKTADNKCEKNISL